MPLIASNVSPVNIHSLAVDNQTIEGIGTTASPIKAKAGGIGNTQLGANAVTGDKILNSTIPLTKIESGSANKLIGTDADGDPIEISAGSGIVINNGTISTSGGGGSVYTEGAITGNGSQSQPIKLLGNVPGSGAGNNKYYGTNGSGQFGMYDVAISPTQSLITNSGGGSLPKIFVKYIGVPPIFSGTSGTFSLNIPLGCDIKAWRVHFGDDNNTLNAGEFTITAIWADTTLNTSHATRVVSNIMLNTPNDGRNLNEGSGLANYGLQNFEKLISGSLVYSGVNFNAFGGANTGNGVLFSVVYG